MSSVAVPLAHAVTHEGTRYDSLNLRRPTVADALAVEGVTKASENEIMLLAAIAGVPDQVIRQVDYYEDYPKLQKVLMGFQPPAPAKSGAGSSSSPASAAGRSKS